MNIAYNETVYAYNKYDSFHLTDTQDRQFISVHEHTSTEKNESSKYNCEKK